MAVVSALGAWQSQEMSASVADSPDEQRYEIHVDGELAGFVEYRGQQTVDLVHTEVFDAFEGQGLAGILVSGALDDLRAKGVKVKATCPYVKRYIEKHAEYQDLLA